MRSIYRDDRPSAHVDPIALKPAMAAKLLNLSEKSLWSITTPRGNLPAVKIGSRTCYFVHQIREWADAELARQQSAEEVAS